MKIFIALAVVAVAAVGAQDAGDRVGCVIRAAIKGLCKTPSKVVCDYASSGRLTKACTGLKLSTSECTAIKSNFLAACGKQSYSVNAGACKTWKSKLGVRALVRDNFLKYSVMRDICPVPPASMCGQVPSDRFTRECNGLKLSASDCNMISADFQKACKGASFNVNGSKCKIWRPKV